jgi:hypothetical protein
MKAVLSVNYNAEHQITHAAVMQTGLRRHGWTVEYSPHDRPTPPGADMVVCWSVKHTRAWDWRKETGGPVLVMERAALQPRTEYVSLGFNGLAGRGEYCKARDGGLRWRTCFEHLQKPWKEPGDGYALIMGQVIGDAALWGVDFRAWAHNRAVELRALGHRVFYRHHPESLRRRDSWRPSLALPLSGGLASSLEGAALVVTYNSTSAVESVLAGVPTVTCDRGSMAWPVTTHAVPADPIRPGRAAWAHDLAWHCFTPAEIESGLAWDHLRELAPCYA